LKEGSGGHRVGPGAQDAGQPAGDQVRVDRVGPGKPQGVAGLRGVERAEDEIVGSAVERLVVGGQSLHHVQVAAQQEQKDRAPGE
jgi:hypothetical protein